jgi:hypothetical protein
MRVLGFLKEKDDKFDQILNHAESVFYFPAFDFSLLNHFWMKYRAGRLAIRVITSDSRARFRCGSADVDSRRISA